MYRKGVFLVQEAMRTLRRYKGVTALSVVIMSLSLLMLAVFLLATDNLLRFVGEAQQDMKIYVYLEDRVSSAQLERLNREILSQEGVASVVFISKSEALDDFRRQLGDDAGLVDVLDTNPLPNAFWVKPKSEYRNAKSMAALAGGVELLDGVEEVRYGREFLDRFTAIVRGVYYVDMVVGFIVILSAIFIISNAVRLTIISRRKNIQILKLVGATNRFITAPFLIEGAFQGGVAAVLSLFLLFVVTAFSQRVVPDLHFFTADKAVVYLLTCILIGSIGSLTALRRYLRMETR
jgi:cell division transport system permease protein